LKKLFKLLITLLVLVGIISVPTNIFAENQYLTNRLIPVSKYSIKAPYEMKPKGICMHNTWNTASARNEASYMESNNKKVSFHVAVDENEALLLIPFNRSAWHAGNNYGNRNFIGIEICRSRDYSTDNFEKAEERAVQVVAAICIEYGWDNDVDTYVKAHRDFANKNCPHRTDMNKFKEKVKSEIKRQKSSMTPIETPIIDNKNEIELRGGRTVKKIEKSDNDRTISKINNKVDNGWILVDKKYKYKNNGKFIVDQVVKIDGKICSFDDNGFCILGGPNMNRNKRGVDKIKYIIDKNK